MSIGIIDLSNTCYCDSCASAATFTPQQGDREIEKAFWGAVCDHCDLVLSKSGRWVDVG